ncbi:hypothetical protein PUMCH_001842 [Australozyma saopauloensis]|uniref:Uncharacterized protein n=1 Tax=Australozyma saopauloensis TaxID=291208 RepID=A0AAX4H7M6_9ASCO|nr:hypothetical protein PUMCH_001842 [[Candida] saopauloensis]
MSDPELINERLHLKPKDRIAVIATVGGMIGAALGLYDGIKLTSLRYLTENAHRLPKTVGGWYFYHKKKNYVMIFGGCREAVRTGIKYSAFVTSFFGFEAGLDYVRGTTDFLNTTVSGLTLTYLYGSYMKMSRVQKAKFVKKGTGMACALGLMQDFLIYKRGGQKWYYNWKDLAL